jgi:acyl carrier protein
MPHLALLIAIVAFSAQEPTARELIERHDREMSPVWADGNRATFFYRGEAEQVTLVMSGEFKPLVRLQGRDDVWTVSLERPARPLRFEVWTGPQAPPAPAVAKPLKGVDKMLELESKALGEKRKIKIYLPPGHDRSNSYPVIYAADGMTNAEILEPLIVAGKVRPVVVVGVLPGNYRGDRAQAYDIKRDLRACEYLPEIDPTRFAKHEKFFCEEVLAWAEKEFGASREQNDRAVHGVSNGARFAVEMGLRHPDLFGHVFGFSVASTTSSEGLAAAARVPVAPGKLPHFRLAAGKWEASFHKLTSSLAEELKSRRVPVVFNSRAAGHDDAMWRQELVAAALEVFGKEAPTPAFRLARMQHALVSWQCGVQREESFRQRSLKGPCQMPDRESLRHKLVTLLEEEMGESYPLPQDDQDLRETLGLDSVDLVGLVMRIEREFHVRLAPEELGQVKRVGDLLDLMDAKLSTTGAHPVSSGPAGDALA